MTSARHRRPAVARPLVLLDYVTIALDDRLVFAHTNWTIRRGEHWAVLGPTGAGKSLLATALCRQVPVVRGEILYYFDEPPSAPPRPHLERGEVVTVSAESYQEFVRRFASYHQARWHSFEGSDCPTVADLLTGRSLEHFSPYQVDAPRVDETIYARRRDRAVSLLGLAELLDRRVIHLSNGETRKVLLARALMQAPKLLILDDPYVGLDAHTRHDLAAGLARLLAVGTPTVVFITPRLEEVPTEIAHLAVVARCRLCYQGSRTGPLPPAIQHLLLPAPRRQTNRPITLPHTVRRPARRANSAAGTRAVPVIEIRDATVRYGQTVVLQSLNWTVRPGENWAVQGANGAGKSTLLSLILGDNPQCYANAVTVCGIRRGSGESLAEIHRKLGFVSPELHAHYDAESTCLDVVCSGFRDSIGLFARCSTPQRRHARAWLRCLGIGALARRGFDTCSLGQQRLVLLARALVKDPVLLVLDEPCQGLDALHRQRVLDVLDVLCRRSTVTVICVTHHEDEIPAGVSHLLVLERGAVRRQGPRR